MVVFYNLFLQPFLDMPKAEKNIYEDVSDVTIYEDVADTLDEKPNVESDTQVKYNHN